MQRERLRQATVGNADISTAQKKLMASAPTFLFLDSQHCKGQNACRPRRRRTSTQCEQLQKQNSNFMQSLPTQTQSTEPRLNSRVQGLRKPDHNKSERSKKTTRDGDPKRKQKTQDTGHHQVRLTRRPRSKGTLAATRPGHRRKPRRRGPPSPNDPRSKGTLAAASAGQKKGMLEEAPKSE